MKKLSIVLTLCLVLTLLPLGTVFASAETTYSNGDVLASLTTVASVGNLYAYYYADDASALAAGCYWKAVKGEDTTDTISADQGTLEQADVAYFKTAREASWYVQYGSTLYLLDDLTYAEAWSGTKTSVGYFERMYDFDNRDITIDGQGHTITSNEGRAFQTKGNKAGSSVLVIKNLNFKAGASIVLQVERAGLVCENVTFEATGITESGVIVLQGNASLELTNCNVKTTNRPLPETPAEGEEAAEISPVAGSGININEYSSDKTMPELKLTGTTINVPGAGVYVGLAGAKVKIYEGTTITSTEEAAIDVKADTAVAITINNGTFTGANDEKACVNAEATVKNGVFTGGNAATATVAYAEGTNTITVTETPNTPTTPTTPEDDGDDTTEAPTEAPEAPTEAPTTAPKADEEESGCASAVSGVALAMIAVLGAGCVAVKRKKN